MADTILIVGAGPIGLTMAMELTRFGQPVRLIDRAAHASDTSKALAVWSRTLELLDRAGCATRFVEAGRKIHGLQIHNGKTVIQGPSFDDLPTPYPYGLMVPQSQTERLLAAELARFGIAVERELELVELSPQTDRVVARLRHADGREETTETPWLLGCDGAHSTVRHQLGVAFEGHAEPDDFLIADIRVDGPVPADELSIFFHADGPLIFFPMPGDRFRVLADLGRGADTRPEPTLDFVQHLMRERSGLALTASDPAWLTSFRISERMVGAYRHGRIFLAGDAAHIHSPVGGQGMNTGMQDAFNLAWKLAMVTQGAAGDWILDSYSPERSAVARRVVDATSRLTQLAMLSNPAAQAVRNFAIHLAMGLHLVQKPAARVVSEIAIAYEGSALSVAAQRRTSLAAGERLAPSDYAGSPPGAGASPRFILYAADLPRAEELAARFPTLLEPEPRMPPRATDLFIVRPDGYIGLAATDHDWDEAVGYLHRLTPA
jgi:2-polyprenyl-6-methoxyphenol hydroxylase-like FAD-dependent oxidoreductase